MQTIYHKLNRLHALVFVIIFAALGVTYLLATHAESSINTVAVTSEVNGVNYNSNYEFTWTNPNGVVLHECIPNVAYGVSKIPGQCQFDQQTNGIVVIAVGSGGSGGNNSNPAFVKWTYANNREIDPSGCSTTSTSCTLRFTDTGDEYVQVTANYSCSTGTTFSASDGLCHSPPPPAPPPPVTPPSGGTTSGSSGTTTNSGSSRTTTHHSSSASSKSSSSSSTGSVSVTPASSSADSNQTTPSLDDTQPANDGGGNISDATDLINVPADTASTISSSDNAVSVSFPSGTFDTDADCSVNLSNSGGQPPNKAGLIGPYSLDCSDSNGNVLTTLNKPVTVSINIPAHKTYTAYINNTKWVATNSSTKGQTMSFELTKAELFAATTKQSTNWGSIVLDVIAIIIFLLALWFIIHLIRRRQYLDSNASPPPSDYSGDYSAQ
jgi:hypothetical protein